VNRDISRNDKFTDISDLVEHPIMMQPPGEPNKPVGIPVMLTSKERKKLRRQRRREAEKDKQEKIQFGMIEKPEPKVCYVHEQEIQVCV
jgi:U4/U6 small nuclear ribonucleoprotein PRP3